MVRRVWNVDYVNFWVLVIFFRPEFCMILWESSFLSEKILCIIGSVFRCLTFFVRVFVIFFPPYLVTRVKTFSSSYVQCLGLWKHQIEVQYQSTDQTIKVSVISYRYEVLALFRNWIFWMHQYFFTVVNNWSVIQKEESVFVRLEGVFWF